MGWGVTGQQELIDPSGDNKLSDDFGYMPLYTLGNSYAMYPFGNTYYYTQRPSAYNEDRKWETTTTYNAGIDFSVLNGRISTNIDGYYRKTRDLLNTVVIPVGTNFGSTLLKNIGSLENYGIEFAINAKPVVTKDFTWDVTYNISWNHNEITELTGNATGNKDYYVPTGTKISRGTNTQIMANRVGYAASSFFVYQQVYDKDGKFLYKNWDLSAAFHASLGNYVYYDNLSSKAAISAPGLYSNSAFTNTTPEAVALGFTGIGTDYWLSDYFVRNASYLKCSNITLGYSFDPLLKCAKKDYFSGRIFFTVQNPFIITKYKGIDPEVSSGVDNNPYPRPMSFQLGVNLNF